MDEDERTDDTLSSFLKFPATHCNKCVSERGHNSWVSVVSQLRVPLFPIINATYFLIQTADDMRVLEYKSWKRTDCVRVLSPGSLHRGVTMN